MGVGKSSILSQYIKQVFPESPLPTIAIEFATKTIKIKEGGYIKAQIWDTAGQEKYKSITSHHYRKAVGALLVYDITRRNTFENCIKWYNELRKFTERNCIVCLVGNKTDILENNENKREIYYEEAMEFAKKYNMLFFETSAKNNSNVDNCFEELLQQIYNEKRKSGKGQLLDSIIIKKGDNKIQNDDSICC